MTKSAVPQATQATGYFVSAPWRSSGKTLLTMGLAAAARQQQLLVQTFKKGPDFIDPRWLAEASGQACYNLDLHQQDTDEIINTYDRHTQACQLSLVEGTMGLHDGLACDGSDSNAAIAKLLDLPVVLIVDCRGMHRTVAALLTGIQQFDPELKIAGVILNRTRSERHAQKIQQAVGAHTDMDVLGVLPDSDALAITEKQLGLTPAVEHDDVNAHIDAIGNLIESCVDVNRLFPAVNNTPVMPSPVTVSSTSARQQPQLRLGIARDEAFHFYYQDDIDYLQSQGVETVFCSPCQGELPAGLDGLWIGGGFPERFAEKLSANASFRSALRREVVAGLPVHAECGGLMYLCRSLIKEGEKYPLCEVIDADVRLSEKPVGRGYMQLTPVGDEKTTLYAHEFHHSSITFDAPPEFTYRVSRGVGVDGDHDGVMLYNVIASYAHFRHGRKTPWIDWFLRRIKDHRNHPVYQHV